jgi:hypothetical protein
MATYFKVPEEAFWKLQSCVFFIHTPAADIEASIDSYSAGLQQLMHRHRAASAMFIFHTTPLTAQGDSPELARLKKWVRTEKLPRYEFTAKGTDDSVEPKRGVLILGVDHVVALDFARQLKITALAFTEFEAVPYALLCNTDHDESLRDSIAESFTAPREDAPDAAPLPSWGFRSDQYDISMDPTPERKALLQQREDYLAFKQYQATLGQVFLNCRPEGSTLTEHDLPLFNSRTSLLVGPLPCVSGFAPKELASRVITTDGAVTECQYPFAFHMLQREIVSRGWGRWVPDGLELSTDAQKLWWLGRTDFIAPDLVRITEGSNHPWFCERH